MNDNKDLFGFLKFALVCVCSTIIMSIFLKANASNFDETEIKTLVEYLGTMLSGGAIGYGGKAILSK